MVLLELLDESDDEELDDDEPESEDELLDDELGAGVLPDLPLSVL